MIPGFAPDHPSWEVLKRQIAIRMAEAGTAVLEPGLIATDTEFHRGQYAALRNLIRDVEEQPDTPVVVPGYDV